MRIVILAILLIVACLNAPPSLSNDRQNALDSAIWYMKNQDFNSAIKFGELALSQMKPGPGQIDSTRLGILYLLYSAYNSTGNSQKAIIKGNEIKSFLETGGDTTRDNYFSLLSSLGGLYLSVSDFPNAALLFKRNLYLVRKYAPRDTFSITVVLNDMADYYSTIGSYREAEPLLVEALDLKKRIFNEDNPEVLSACNNLGYIYHLMGDYNKAEYYYEIVLSSARKQPGLKKNDLAIYLANLGLVKTELGNYKEAEELLRASLDIRREIFKSDSPSLALSINNYAYVCFLLEKFDESEQLYKEALDMKRRLFKSDNYDVSATINNLAALYDTRGLFDKAEPLYMESFNIRKGIFDVNSQQMETAVSNLGSFYYRYGRFDKAQKYLEQAHDILASLYKSYNLKRYENASLLAQMYMETGDRTKAADVFDEYYSQIRYMINDYVAYLDENEKEFFLDDMAVFNSNFYSFCLFNNDSAWIDKAFNTALLTKSLIFRLFKNLVVDISSGGDSTLAFYLNKWQSGKETIAKVINLPASELSERGLNMDSLMEESRQSEKELIRRYNFSQSELQDKAVLWSDIQKSLSKDEAAIEIVRFGKYGRMPNYYNHDVLMPGFTDTIYYAAFIITRNCGNHPLLVILDNGSGLENKYISLYQDLIRSIRKSKIYGIKTPGLDSYISASLSALYDQYWAKIQEKLAGIKKVYISLDGIYHIINLNTLLDPSSGQFLVDRLDLINVQSTADIINIKSRQANNKLPRSADLFGNPRFLLDSGDTDLPKGKKASPNQIASTDNAPIPQKPAIAPLPGTQKEVMEISSLLRKKGWHVNLFLDNRASEQAVKKVSSPGVLHIATHGNFLKGVQPGRNIYGIAGSRYVENPLLRSMLLFSGAENTMANKRLHVDNDGILTAYEAMNLHLENTQLVVMSACETGLGEIRNGEGVYGLQRAFLLAGARSVIMSLWNVNDESTRLLMTSFYKNWLSGSDMHSAFRKAVLSVRKKYPEFYYWGAFVMLGE